MPHLEKDPSREGRENNELQRPDTEPFIQFCSHIHHFQLRDSVRQLHGQDQHQETTALCTYTESRAQSFPVLGNTSALVTSVTRHVDAISPSNSPVGDHLPLHQALSINSSSKRELLRRAFSVGSTANLHTSAAALGRRPSSVTESALLPGTASHVQNSRMTTVRSFQAVQATDSELTSADNDSGLAALPASIVMGDDIAVLPDVQLLVSSPALTEVGGTAASGSSASNSTEAGGPCMAPMTNAVSQLIPGSQAQESDNQLGAVGGVQPFPIMPMPSNSRVPQALVSTAFQSVSQNAEHDSSNAEEDDVFDEGGATFQLVPQLRRNLQGLPTFSSRCHRRVSCIF